MLRLGLPRAGEPGEGQPPEGPAPPADSRGPGDAWSSHLARVLERLRKRIAPDGRYEIEGELARGGQGQVLRVWDEDLQRRLAMKLVLERPARAAVRSGEGHHDSRTLGRFLDEVQISAQLDHPGIVPVHEVGMDAAGRIYFTMKLVKGRDLKAIFALLARKAEGWNETRALGVVLKVCEAMAYAHSKGVIHRDLKPANIMVGNFGEVFVMDWGLARVLGRDDSLDIRPATEGSVSEVWTAGRELRENAPDSPLGTRDGDVIGTPAYMPPEQARGDVERVSKRSDVYSIGAMLYHLLAGHPPYVPPGVRPTDHMLLWRLIHEKPRPLAQIRPGLASELVAIVERAMARAPDERYADTLELAEDLRAFMEHRVVRSFQAGPWVELRKWVERNRKLAFACAAGILALAGGLIASLALKADADRSAIQAQQSARAALEHEQRARESQRIADERARDLLSLSALQVIEDLRTEADRLWPAEPENIAAYVSWSRRARELLEELPEHERKLAELEARPRALEVPPAAETFERRAAELGLELAWTLFQLGRYDRALEQADEILRTAVDSLRPELEGRCAVLREEIDQAIEQDRALAATPELERHAAELRQALEALAEPRLESGEDRWWSAQLHKLLGELRALADPETGLMGAGISPHHGWGIERRRRFAATLRARSLEDPEPARLWREALESIADPDRCPAYRGLRIEPQLGLWPSGRDPDSGLWEFVHLATGEPPRRDQAGRLIVSGDMGLVFVLLPGGSSWLGAQNRFSTGRNFDPAAKPDDGPVHPVMLSPFFLSKYEMTQGQWLRATGNNPSLDSPARYELYWNSRGLPIDLAHPVEQVTGYQCLETLGRLGLELPSEAQWEYAARAGTSTVYWTGDDPRSLRGAANLADRHAQGYGGAGWTTIEEWLDDGHTTHARVGSFAANAFGLHDVCGNVWERCADVYDPRFYENSPRRDPLARGPLQASRVSRGGSFSNGADFARSGLRNYSSPESADNGLGLRPALRIRGPVR